MNQFLWFIGLSLWHIFSFAQPIHTLSVIHPVLGVVKIIYEPIQNYAISEGDIILTERTKPTFNASLIRLETRRWPEGRVPYEIDPTLPEANRTAVLNAIMLWEKRTNIHFIERTPHNQHAYPDYVRFIPNDQKLCASYVGRHGGAQDVQLSSRCTTMITAHEIGHVLGLWHEQSRMDRDNYVYILWENIEPRARYNFQQHLTDGVDHGPYNYQSIMHYSPYAFSKNGEKTIIPLQEGVIIGQRDTISPLDVIAIKTLYPSL